MAQNSGGFDIDRFRKLKEFSIPEKSIEVMAPLRDKARAVDVAEETVIVIAVGHKVHNTLRIAGEEFEL